MEYVYAALMLHKLKKEINEANITSIVKSSGAEVKKSLVASLADVNIDEAIKAAPVAAAPAGAPAESKGDSGEAKGEKKKDKAADGKSEEQAMEGLSALFG